MSKVNFKNIQILKILRYLLILIGLFFLLCVFLAFTSLPFWGLHWLGTSKSELTWEPKTIILLGGGGMPSESNLIRSWYTEKAASTFIEATVLIAMPGMVNDTLSTPQLMQKELLTRGINIERIKFEAKGKNTRSQALNCATVLNRDEPVLLVTSPENMRRSVLCFRKAGFKKVNALPAFENATEADLTFKDDELGGNKKMVPDVGKSINLRYQVWNHLKYEITFAREIMALSYYRLRGWI
jgi:uncharacterized SAM-binding protein YcdF (DUF218 family)